MLQILREVADPGKVDPVHKDEVGMLSLDELERFAHRMMAEGVKMEREACAKLCEEESDFAAEIGHERFMRYSAEMAGKIRNRMAEQLEKGE